MAKKTKTKKEFKGSWGTFILLLCLGIIPALFYYWYKCEEIEEVVEE